jgi:hypothetical protein
MTGHFTGKRGSITPKKSGAIKTEKSCIRILTTYVGENAKFHGAVPFRLLKGS